MKPRVLPRLIYEIATASWLERLSRQAGHAVTLASVPAEVWDGVAGLGVDAVWLMGVWERSPVAAAVARTHPAFANDRAQATSPEAVCGSAYAIRSYSVDARFGGERGLLRARQELARRGLRLVLDWVPNHVAPDHAWAEDHPDWCVRGSEPDLARDPGAWIRVGAAVLARGRDPYFPPWPDTVQLDLSSPGLRRAAAQSLASVARRCDAVRCDMAMLALPEVFARTWRRPQAEGDAGYWPPVLAEARRSNPGLMVLGECYWGLEQRLLDLGFDACYDKAFYDALIHGDAAAIRAAAGAEGRIRFLENHDEPRCTVAMPERSRRQAAGVAVATLPGCWLFHAGQEQGHRIRLPVTLASGSDEPADPDACAWWGRLMQLRRMPACRGAWSMVETSGWPDNGSHGNLLGWIWQGGGQALLTVVNWSGAPAQARVRVPAGCRDPIAMNDILSGAILERSWSEISREGLYVDLPPWGYHVLGWDLPAT